MARISFRKFLTPADLGLFALVALYVAAGYVIAVNTNATGFYNPVMYVSTGITATKALLMGYIVLWGLWAFYVMLFVRPTSPKAYFKEHLQRYAFNKERYIRALPVFVACIVLLSTFTSLKVMIPHVNGFKWDLALVEMDRLLFGGMDAWKVLHPALGYPPITLAINFVYNIWLLVLYVGLYWQLLSVKDQHTRMQFFYSLVLAWAINGSFLAMYYSSAGPCYFQEVLGLGQFEPLFAYLESIGGEGQRLWALVNQDHLWGEYITNKHGIGAGISAMPSVHVTTAFLFMMAGLRSDKKYWRYTGVAFFVIILLGSVHLGWHYATDGIAAILTTYLIWKISGWLLTKLGS